MRRHGDRRSGGSLRLLFPKIKERVESHNSVLNLLVGLHLKEDPLKSLNYVDDSSPE